MNQFVRTPRLGNARVAFNRASIVCDLPMLTAVVLSTMKPLLSRRGQHATIETPQRPVVVRGDIKLVASLLSVVLLEAAGLSSANATLRVAFDVDEGDGIVTVVGENIHRLSLAGGELDGELASLAAEAGAELELLWDPSEGPTLLLRLPLRPVPMRAGSMRPS